jgi:hypothetical protein
VSRREDAARAIVAKVLADEAAKVVKAARRLVEDELEPGEQISAVLPDGTRVGKVKLTEASQTVRVTDEAALLEFVRRVYPDEVVTTEHVRESFRGWLLDVAKTQLTDPEGDGHVVLGDGEVVPGVELVSGTPSYRPEPSTEGRAHITARLGEVLGGELLALPGGES